MDKGMKQLDRAVELFPTDAWLVNMRGLVHLKEGDAFSARRDFTWAVELSKASYASGGSREELAEYLNNLASALGELGKYEEVELKTSQALMLSPKRTGLLYFNRALARIKLNKLDAALSDLRAAAKSGHRGAADMLINLDIKP